MAEISQLPTLENLGGQIRACSRKAASSSSSSSVMIPVIDLSDPNAKTHIVEACTTLGFFKVTHHGFSTEFLAKLEAEAFEFFKLSLQVKKNSGPPNPDGYGHNDIGPNGDKGWLEFLLFCTNSHPRVPGISDALWGLVRQYVEGVKDMTCLVTEMIAEEMGMGDTKILSRLLRDEKSDSRFRVNHYPVCLELRALPAGRTMIGLGEHTDPQILSVLRSNDAAGLQICLRDGTWTSVPSDHTNFYFGVGDTLQVITNGKFQSIKHRVLANGFEERLSMVYFGGPPLSEKVRPLFLKRGEESMYKEFTWSEYKNSAYKTKLGDDRLASFQKSAASIAPH